jgi:hypothetical protein
MPLIYPKSNPDILEIAQEFRDLISIKTMAEAASIRKIGSKGNQEEKEETQASAGR